MNRCRIAISFIVFVLVGLYSTPVFADGKKGVSFLERTVEKFASEAGKTDMGIIVPVAPERIEASAENRIWMAKLDAWIVDIGDCLIVELEDKLDRKAFELYQEKERRITSSLYQRVNLRLFVLLEIQKD
jgi:hypothetical protein